MESGTIKNIIDLQIRKKDILSYLKKQSNLDLSKFRINKFLEDILRYKICPLNYGCRCKQYESKFMNNYFNIENCGNCRNYFISYSLNNTPICKKQINRFDKYEIKIEILFRKYWENKNKTIIFLDDING